MDTNIKELQYRLYVYQVGKSFWKIIEREWSEWLSESSIGISEYTILMTLHSYGRMSVSELSVYGAMHISNAQNSCNALEKKGFVIKEKDNFDRRISNVSITGAGKRQIFELEKHWNANASLAMNEIYKKNKEQGKKPLFLDEVSLINQFRKENHLFEMLDYGLWEKSFAEEIE